MDEGQDLNANLIKELGMFGLKTLLTLNAGACLALLAFLGNVLTAENPKITLAISAVRCSLVWFLLGIAAVLLSVLITYISVQLQYYNKYQPQVRKSYETARFWGFLLSMIGAPVASFACFAWGAWTAFSAIK